MRDVIVAANWKMHTTPADAGELAATIASRTREPDVTRVICPPFVCLAAVRDALADSDPDVAVGRPERPPRGGRRVHRRGLGADAGRARDLGHRRPLGAAARLRRDRRADRPASSAGRPRRACAPILCVGERWPRSARPGDAEAVVEAQLAGRARRPRPGASSRPPAWSSPTSPSGRSGPAATRSGSDAAAMAEAIRRTPRRRWGGGVPPRTCPSCTAAASRPRASPSSSPSPAIDGALVGGRVAQARRDGRHRGPGRTRPPAPAARRGVTSAPRPIVLVVLDGFGIGGDPADGCHRRRPDAAPGAACSRAGRTRRLRASEDAVGLPPGQMGNSEVGHLNLGAGPARSSRTCRGSMPRSPTARSSTARRSSAACARARERRRRPRTSSASSGRAASTPTTGISSPSPSWPARQGVPRASASTRCSTGATRRRARPSGSSRTSRRGWPPPIRMPRSRPSAAATSRWTATSAGSGSSAATTRSSTAMGEPRRRARPRPSRPPTPAARPTSSSPRPSSTAPTSRALGDGDPIIHANFRADRARQLTHALADGRRSTASTGRRRPAARRRPTCSS